MSSPRKNDYKEKIKILVCDRHITNPDDVLFRLLDDYKETHQKKLLFYKWQVFKSQAHCESLANRLMYSLKSKEPIRVWSRWVDEYLKTHRKLKETDDLYLLLTRFFYYFSSSYSADFSPQLEHFQALFNAEKTQHKDNLYESLYNPELNIGDGMFVGTINSFTEDLEQISSNVIDGLIKISNDDDCLDVLRVFNGFKQAPQSQITKLVNVLLDLLSNKNQEIRSVSCEMLGKLANQGEQFREKIVAALIEKSYQEVTMQDMVMILGAISCVEKLPSSQINLVLDVMIAKTKDSNCYVRAAACKALAHIKEYTLSYLPSIVDNLNRCSQDDDWQVAENAYIALTNFEALSQDDSLHLMSHLKPSDNACGYVTNIFRQHKTISSSLLDKIICCFLCNIKNEDPLIAANAAFAIGDLFNRISPHQRQEVLTQLLLMTKTNQEAYVLAYIYYALGKVTPALVGERYSEVLDQLIVGAAENRDCGPYPNLKTYSRAFACEALGEMRSIPSNKLDKVVEVLMAGIKQIDTVCQENAIKALLNILKQLSTDSLIKVLVIVDDLLPASKESFFHQEVVFNEISHELKRRTEEKAAVEQQSINPAPLSVSKVN